MLNGIRVIEFEGLGPGPFAGMMLADLGAEVIVIHRPDPPTPISGDRSPLDRGKKSVVLDLKDASDVAAALSLVASADALIEGFRPGVMERLGLGPAVCHAANPALAYGRMTGWGQTGPRAIQAGHDFNYLATSGALWYTSPPGQPPFPPPTLLGDIGGGAMYLVAGLLAGLLNAGRTGQGTVVDAAIVDGSAHMMALMMSTAASGNLVATRGQSLFDGSHWSRSYACADGRYLSVQCLEAKFYAEFLERLGLNDDPEMAEQFDRSQWPVQNRRLETLFATQTADHWAAVFEGSDACVAPVLSPWEAATDPHMDARGVWQDAGDGALQPAPAPRFDGAYGTLRPPPERGEHTVEILEDLRGRD